MLHVRVEAQVGGRHHHCQRCALHIALNGCAALPDGLIIPHAVEQVQHRKFTIRRGAGEAVPGGALGEDHVQIYAHL
ncbi:hypothetical protein [Ruminococcus sp. CAG:379]|uniref:hypothetical protein n=1 Tax=Ruminococcus sp. CAG:379 TaxID=1262956 RepID=UPI00258A1DFB|nr:hypothetical protein [Ruminococcus sp. CAG:379]